MTCMDIIKKLDPKDRAECWTLFTKLSRVFMVSKSGKPEIISELKNSAEKMNAVFVKNGFESYFNTDVDDISFIEMLVAEMSEIKNGKKLKD